MVLNYIYGMVMMLTIFWA